MALTLNITSTVATSGALVAAVASPAPVPSVGVAPNVFAVTAARPVDGQGNSETLTVTVAVAAQVATASIPTPTPAVSQSPSVLTTYARLADAPTVTPSVTVGPSTLAATGSIPTPIPVVSIATDVLAVTLVAPGVSIEMLGGVTPQFGGIQHTMPANRLDHTMPSSRLVHTVPENRFHHTMRSQV